MKIKETVKVFCLEKHQSCFKYTSTIHEGFSCDTWACGTIHKEVVTKETLFFLLEGTLMLQYKGETLELKDKHMLFFSRQDIVTVEVTETCQVVIAQFEKLISPCTRLHLEDLVKLKNKISTHINPLKIKDPLCDFIHSVQTYLNNGINCTHLHELKLRELFLLLRYYYSDADLAKFLYSFLGAKKEEDFRILVVDNWIKNRNVKDLSALCNMSESTFRRHFIQEFGEPIGEWIKRNLKDTILYKLSEKDTSINQLASDLNFSSTAHFSTYCKNTFGMTPTQLREKSIDK